MILGRTNVEVSPESVTSLKFNNLLLQPFSTQFIKICSYLFRVILGIARKIDRQTDTSHHVTSLAEVDRKINRNYTQSRCSYEINSIRIVYTGISVLFRNNRTTRTGILLRQALLTIIFVI